MTTLAGGASAPRFCQVRPASTVAYTSSAVPTGGWRIAPPRSAARKSIWERLRASGVPLDVQCSPPSAVRYTIPGAGGGAVEQSPGSLEHGGTRSVTPQIAPLTPSAENRIQSYSPSNLSFCVQVAPPSVLW